MKKFRRIAAVLMAALMASAAATGCSSETTSSGASSSGESSSSSEAGSSSDGGEASESGEEYDVYFYAWTNPDNVVELVDAFNAEYEGKYNLIYQKLNDAATMTINTALASGEQIDVMTQASAIDVRTRADSGTYLGLKQFLDADGYDYTELFGESVEQVYNFDGDYYAVPYCNNINVVWYNKNMFDEAGVEYPADDWTWDDFREIAKQMTSGEGANKIYGAMMDYGGPSEGGGGDQYWQLIAQQKLGSFTYYNDDFTATQFDAPEYKESLQFFYDMAMVDQTLVPISEYTTLKYNSDTNGMIGLYNGKYAMWVAPVYGCLYLNDSYSEVPEGTNIAMANLPRPVGSTENISITYSSQASIPANAPNPEASWALLKFICIEHPELFAGPKAMHPGVIQTPEEAEEMNEIIFGNHPGLDAEQAISIINQDRTLITKDNTHVEGQVKINDLIQADMALVFNGEMSVDEALADLKTKGDQYIQEDMAE